MGQPHSSGAAGWWTGVRPAADPDPLWPTRSQSVSECKGCGQGSVFCRCAFPTKEIGILRGSVPSRQLAYQLSRGAASARPIVRVGAFAQASECSRCGQRGVWCACAGEDTTAEYNTTARNPAAAGLVSFVASPAATGDTEGRELLDISGNSSSSAISLPVFAPVPPSRTGSIVVEVGSGLNVLSPTLANRRSAN